MRAFENIFFRPFRNPFGKSFRVGIDFRAGDGFELFEVWLYDVGAAVFREVVPLGVYDDFYAPLRRLFDDERGELTGDEALAVVGEHRDVGVRDFLRDRALGLGELFGRRRGDFLVVYPQNVGVCRDYARFCRRRNAVSGGEARGDSAGFHEACDFLPVGVASDPRDRRNFRPQRGDVGCYIPHAAEHGDFARLFENGHGGFGGYSLDFAVYKSVEHGVADAQYFQRRKFFQ